MADSHYSAKSNGTKLEEEMPGTSTSRLPIKVKAIGGVGPPLKTQQILLPMRGNSPVREAMFLKKDRDGKMVVVKRVIRKMRKVQIMPGEELVQSSESGQDTINENIRLRPTARMEVKEAKMSLSHLFS